MPTYEYKCENCGNRFEVFQKITDATLSDCPACGKKTLSRGPGGGIGLSFTGSGWYKTDYASAKPVDNGQGTCCPCGKNSGSCSSTEK